MRGDFQTRRRPVRARSTAGAASGPGQLRACDGAGVDPFVTDLRAASSNPVLYAELPGAQHSFELFHSVRFETVVNGIEMFAAWVAHDTLHMRQLVELHHAYILSLAGSYSAQYAGDW